MVNSFLLKACGKTEMVYATGESFKSHDISPRANDMKDFGSILESKQSCHELKFYLTLKTLEYSSKDLSMHIQQECMQTH